MSIWMKDWRSSASTPSRWATIGLILFLDELILWLATHSADLNFVQTEGNKLAKLVESRKTERPVPIISFVARQRDLRELIGENVTGVDQLNFSDVLSHWEGRFHTITLEDRNLPAYRPEAGAQTHRRCMPGRVGRLLREDSPDPTGDHGGAADTGGRPCHVQASLSLQPGADPGPRGGVECLAAGTHGLEDHAATAGQPARHVAVGRRDSRWAISGMSWRMATRHSPT